MKHKLFVIVAAICIVPMGLFGQTYQSLWKQVEEAQNKDLPQTAVQHLQKIEKKAQKEHSYGHLLKATLLASQLQAEIAPDSLPPAVSRLEQQERDVKDLPLKAVYDVVLSKIYQENRQLADDWKAKSQEYAASALAHPEALASVKTDTYEPFVVKGKDSELYGHDLLSVIGRELKAWQDLHRYYSKTGNRRAACITGAEAFDNVAALDSLLQVYGDLPEACELAIRRFQLMGTDNYPIAQKMDFLRSSIKRWGSWRRVNWLRNMEQDLTRPQFSARILKRVAMPQESQTVALDNLRNLESLTMRVFRTSLKGDTNLDAEEVYKKYKSQLKEVEELKQTRYFIGHEDYEIYEDSMTLGGLEPGVYLVEFSSPNIQTSRQFYYVSGVRLLSQAMPNNEMRYVAVDARTGKPLPDAVVQKTDRYGNAMFAYTPTDCYCPPVSLYGRYYYYDYQYGTERISLFSDRSIYRPGQTVHVSAIVWKELSATDHIAVADKKVRIELRDANYKVVKEMTVTTDRYGKCATEFILPAGLLNGRFTLCTSGQSISIQVEEYKRPSFQVEFADYQETYQAGDTVQAQGKALTYAGVPVQGAKVKYTVRRKVAFWWLSYSRYWENGFMGSTVNNEVVKEGEAVTADDGTFRVEMPMLLPKELGRRPMFYHFVVEADVTDLAGETHSGTLSLPLGNKPTALTCDIPEQIRKDQLPPVTFNRRNAAGKEIAGTVKYCVDGGKWKECAANSSVFHLPSSIKSGSHRLEAVCGQDTLDIKFVVFGLDDKKPATQTNDWFYVSHQQFPNDGSPVTLQVGSSAPDLYIFYAIYAGNKVIEKGEVKKNGELINRQFTYKEEFGNGLLLSYVWVKDGECYSHQQTISRPMPDKRLRLTWETFRDRLVPGQQEEWRLKIQNPDGTPAEASLLAVLYDKSLDAIKQHQWHFAPTSFLPMPSTSWQYLQERNVFWSGIQRNQKMLSVDNMMFSYIDGSVFPHYYYYRIGGIRIRGAQPMMAKASKGATSIGGRDEYVMESANMMADIASAKQVAAATDEVYEKGAAQSAQEENSPMGIRKRSDEGRLLPEGRKNMDETAFFYPMLETDQTGNVVMKFTLPESLTTWRFMGVANTVNMLYGNMEGEVVAQKELMVQPNMPRFLREGDEATITMRIINMGQQTMKNGTALLRLYDAESEVLSVSEPFEVEAGKTTSVSFRIPASVLKPTLLTCKVSAIATTAGLDGFSDGEQHYLPVLSNKEYVTKTVPYTQHEPGVKTINLTKLFPAGTTQQKLTVEYTNNPTWLMIQSLPILGQPWEHSAIDQAASYYSNLLAKTLLVQNPQVKTVFEQWKNEEKTISLASQLEKNQELKDLVLNETPWVNAADRESEQKQRLADFFDENGINNRLEMAVGKLQKLQNADGSFSWYPGMLGSRHITVAVMEMLVRLNKMAGEQSATKQMGQKAFKYIAHEIVEMVKEMKKAEKKGHKPSFPSFTALRWLYLCAIDGRVLSSDVKTANNYLIALLKKDLKRQTIYEKALTAVVLDKHGEHQKAAAYVRSLKEYTVFTEEMGRYYDTPRAAYSWYDYKIPTEVAAIEAIQQVTPNDTRTIDEMRRWLLQEKRTQTWDTPINSVNAIWAFLANNTSQTNLTSSTIPTTLAIDGAPINLPKATAGLGYVKTAISHPQGKTFTATKTSEGTSWGAVYAQFLQKTSEVEAAQSGITIKREIMGSSLKVGDRIKVRITIETSRDLDFVQVVDHRAACMEPVRQLSGYQQGAYVSPKDAATHYFYGGLSKGKHEIYTEYYIDRAGHYETGTCSVGCAYAPEYRATAPSITLNVEEK